jgi:hypothetical protein
MAVLSRPTDTAEAEAWVTGRVVYEGLHAVALRARRTLGVRCGDSHEGHHACPGFQFLVPYHGIEGMLAIWPELLPYGLSFCHSAADSARLHMASHLKLQHSQVVTCVCHHVLLCDQDCERTCGRVGANCRRCDLILVYVAATL